MDMIIRYLSGDYVYIMLHCYLPEYISCPYCYFSG